MTTTRVSTAADGTQGDAESTTAANLGTLRMSADGRYVVFQSDATNLVAGDTNDTRDIFVKDTLTGAITLVSTSDEGGQSNGDSSNASISADGRYIAFESLASNLVAGDTNRSSDIFIKDLATGTTTRVSTTSAGGEATGGPSNAAAISADGRYVAFQSNADNLVAGDTNGRLDIFVKDLTTGTTTRVSTDSAGGQASGGSSIGASISADGSRVAFRSNATNLVAGDTNSSPDLFVKDLSTGATTRVSTDSAGGQAVGDSIAAAISADGTRVAFQSDASNLVADDTNNQIDVFVKDLATGTTTRVNTTSAGGEATGGISLGAAISADGSRVAFLSNASNLVADDTNSSSDIFVKDLSTGAITRVSTTSAGEQAVGDSSFAAISDDGTRVAFTSSASTLVADDTNNAQDVFMADVPCYVTGTRIRTRAGDVAVEDLAVGDLAVTASGAHRPICWIGNRTMACRGRKDVLPVRIAAHAFGKGSPARDLFVSPAHAIAVNILGEVLIPACRLINGTTITQVDVEEVTYWHVETDSHDILLAEGLPAESYLDCGNRRFFANTEVTDLLAVPDARPEGPLPFCRPFHEAGLVVDLVRARLEDRAVALGWHKVDEPFAGLHLVADGRMIRPAVQGLTARFLVPANARDVRLVSATSVPAHTVPGSSDDRHLGVALAALMIDDGLTGARAVALDDARLGDGFYGAEDGANWTNGSALLSADLWAGCKGSFFLRVTLATPALPRWIAPGETAGVVELADRRQA